MVTKNLRSPQIMQSAVSDKNQRRTTPVVYKNSEKAHSTVKNSKKELFGLFSTSASTKKLLMSES